MEAVTPQLTYSREWTVNAYFVSIGNIHNILLFAQVTLQTVSNIHFNCLLIKDSPSTLYSFFQKYILIYNFLQNITPWQNPRLHYKYRGPYLRDATQTWACSVLFARTRLCAYTRFHCNHSHAWEPVCMFARTTLSLRARLHGSPRLINAVGSTKVNRVNSSFQRK
jgi:hypothetical protein